MTAPEVRPDWCVPDHPCGSRQSYDAGCRGDSCRLMMILHTKGDVSLVYEIPDSRIAADGHAQLLRAFQREGYSFDDLATICGLAGWTLKHIAWGVTRSIYPDTARAIERLVQTLPSEAVSA